MSFRETSSQASNNDREGFGRSRGLGGPGDVPWPAPFQSSGIHLGLGHRETFMEISLFAQSSCRDPPRSARSLCSQLGIFSVHQRHTALPFIAAGQNSRKSNGPAI